MWNITKRPFEKETLDDWAKIANDIAKVAILAIPVMLYGKDPIYLKIINSILLLIATYAALQSGRIVRRYKLKQEETQ